MSKTDRRVVRLIVPMLLVLVASVIFAMPRRAFAAQLGQPESQSERVVVQEGAGGETNLRLPDLTQVEFRGINGRSLLIGGLWGSARWGCCSP